MYCVTVRDTKLFLIVYYYLASSRNVNLPFGYALYYPRCLVQDIHQEYSTVTRPRAGQLHHRQD